MARTGQEGTRPDQEGHGKNAAGHGEARGRDEGTNEAVDQGRGYLNIQHSALRVQQPHHICHAELLNAECSRYLCSLDLLPRLVNVLIAPRNTTQIQKSTNMPKSRRAGSCRAAGGKCGISRKYTAFPAKTAISDWTKFTIVGFDTGKLKKQQNSHWSSCARNKGARCAHDVRRVPLTGC